MSKQWENEKAKNIHRQTGEETRVYTCGYSGNNAMPQPDILLTRPTQDYGLELKGPIKKDTCYVQADDIDQIMQCSNSYTIVGLVIKFQRREPLVVRHFEKLSSDQHPDAENYNGYSPAEQFAALIAPCFDPRVTDAGTLAVDKPSTEDWPSATAGSSDEDAILSGLGIPTEESTTIER